MRLSLVIAGLLLSGTAAASKPADFAKQWPVVAEGEGAYALQLDQSVYGQTLRPDLLDIAAFNADGEPLPFGPMPPSYCPPPSVWREAVWFAVPSSSAASTVGAAPGSDMHLHVSRGTDGELQLDASFNAGDAPGGRDVLVDVRAKDHLIEGISFGLGENAPDITAQVAIDASDDLENWHTLVGSATIAQLRQSGQMLARRHIDIPPTEARYLRIRPLAADVRLPVSEVRLQLRPPGLRAQPPARRWFTAAVGKRDGRAFTYSLPARIPVEQVAIDLADDNTIAAFTISVRDDARADWQYVGSLTAFRLRGAGLELDNEPLDTAIERRREWRIEANIDLEKAPALKLAFRPEPWLLLTHGKGPYVITAGSPRAQRSDFPLEALVGQVRSKYGADWQPTSASLGPMREAGGVDALKAYSSEDKRTWVLWGVLLLGAVVVIVMVLKLLKAPPAG